jgi:hypothetical protein
VDCDVSIPRDVPDTILTLEMLPIDDVPAAEGRPDKATAAESEPIVEKHDDSESGMLSLPEHTKLLSDLKVDKSKDKELANAKKRKLENGVH